jgi:hypothetical protein
MTKLLLPLPLAFVALLIACENGGGGEVASTVGVIPSVTVSPQPDGETPTSRETPTPRDTPTPRETPAETPTGEPEVCQPNPDPATPEFQVIDQPSAGDTVTSPVTISGQVLAFEGTYQIGIFDADGDPIVETFGTAEAVEIGELGSFSIDVAFDVDEPTPACIWVYEQSARDGSPINVGQIPVTLSP